MQHSGRSGLAALVVNFNTARLTGECVRSLLDAGVETVHVLDNGSEAADHALLAASHAGEGRVRLVRSDQNLGFAAGNNRLIDEALRDSACQRLMLVNSDATVAAPGLDACLAEMHRLGAQLMGARMVKPGGGEVESLGIVLYKCLLASNRMSPEAAYLGPTGGFAIYSRGFLEDVRATHGYVFDPSYFCYAEDTDLAVRARLLGHRAGYCDEVVAHHEGQGSHGEGRDDFILYHGIRNSIWMMAKSIPGEIIATRLHWVVLLHGGIVLRHMAGGRWRTLWRLYRDALCGLPRVLRERRAIQASRRMPVEDFRAVIDSHFYEPAYLERAWRELFGKG
jgi:N-acetylglucosaminyl-diphospho-decaprenol L-rhamnosyltransferase